LVALRGATTVDVDDGAAIVEATAELLQALLDRNDVASSDVVSMIFTATPDLTAEFPAAGARKLGMSDIPLLDAAAPPMAGDLPRCVRVLVHLYTDRPKAELRHVYLKETKRLRTDLAGPA
jgi:chorismate mutase